jgi:hypothetical protein
MVKFPLVSVIDLGRVSGGVNWAEIKQKAQPYCPKTVEKYGSLDPSKVTRPLAQEMGNACLAEMGPGKAFFAKGTIHKAIDEAFPPK